MNIEIKSVKIGEQDGIAPIERSTRDASLLAAVLVGAIYDPKLPPYSGD